MTILDATAADVKLLDDVQLRRLVARLAAAELRARGQSETGVNDSGEQRAADGGVDVMVEGDRIAAGDILIALPLGIQVKATPMRRAAILKEMRPAGRLRPAILQLADRGGGYLIAAGRDDRSASALEAARTDMRDALGGEAGLPVDFLDAGRLARWASQHPGVTRWLLDAAGRPTYGWRTLEPWSTPNQSALSYLADDRPRFRLGGEAAEPTGIVEGLNRLRQVLATEGAVARLVGLSGMGKTRLAEALFDTEVGEGALPSGLAVYGDAAADPATPPMSFAGQLVDSRRRAILIVDNCPPALHRELEALTRRTGSRVSLLTIDFDTGPDQPEHTHVFRIGGAGDMLIDRLLIQRFPELTWGDRARIASFADGNTRIALVLARTARAGGELTGLSDPQLLDRLFLNSRRGPDSSLRAAAGAGSLVYAFEITRVDGLGEADILAEIAGLSTLAFHRKVGDLLERGMAQQRGVQRAVLPPAIAGCLAEETLAALPTGVVLDRFVGIAPSRLTRSFVRRLSLLGSTASVTAIAERLLAPDGWLGRPTDLMGDDMAMVRDLSRHAPGAALAVAKEAIRTLTPESAAGPRYSARNALVELLQSLSRNALHFEGAVELMADLAMVEGGDGSDRIRPRLLQAFQMSHSGVEATTEQRLAILARWAKSPAPGRAGLAIEALDAALSFNPRHFYPLDIHGHPMRSRGAVFETIDEVVQWIEAALSILAQLADGPLASVARSVFLRRFDALARREFSVEPALRYFDRLEAGRPWRGAWFAVCKALARTPVSDRDARVVALEARLRPRTIVERFDTWLYCEWHAWHDPDTPGDTDWKRAREAAVQVGSDAAGDPDLDALLTRALFDPEARGGAFAEGYARSVADKASGWARIRAQMADRPGTASCWRTVGGYVGEVAQTHPELAERWIDDLLGDPETLAVGFSIVAARPVHDDRDLGRMLVAIQVSDAPEIMDRIWWGRPADDASDAIVVEIVDFLLAAGRTRDAYRFLDSRLQRDTTPWSEALVAAGRRLLDSLEQPEDLDDGDVRGSDLRDYQLARLTGQACRGAGGEPVARRVLEMIRRRMLEGDGWLEGMPQTLGVLCARYPVAVLDSFLLGEDLDHDARFKLDHVLQPMTFDDEDETALSGAPGDPILAWVDEAPEQRAAALARVAPFLVNLGPETPPTWTPLALALITRPGGEGVREALGERMFSGGGTGSAADRFRRREPMIRVLADHADPAVRAWSSELLTSLDAAIAFHEGSDRQRDQRFE